MTAERQKVTSMERRKSTPEHDDIGSAATGHGSDAHAHSHDESAEIEELRRRIEALRVDLAQADRRLRVMVRQRPGLAVAAALLSGFVLGRIIRRI